VTEIELKIPFGQAITRARRMLGPSLYYLHNQVGSQDWAVQQRQGRVYLRVQDPQIAVYFRLKI
jgi:hypothetical protein